jgi:hypothetical protein
MYKLEISFGFIDAEKLVIETWDFEKIQIIADFIQFQQDYGWAVEYEAVEDFDLEDEVKFDDEEDTEEELEGSESAK